MKRCDFGSKFIENHPFNKKWKEKKKPTEKIRGNLLDNEKMEEKSDSSDLNFFQYVFSSIF